jgi:hypothetical protein
MEHYRVAPFGEEFRGCLADAVARTSDEDASHVFFLWLLMVVLKGMFGFNLLVNAERVA